MPQNLDRLQKLANPLVLAQTPHPLLVLRLHQHQERAHLLRARQIETLPACLAEGEEVSSQELEHLCEACGYFRRVLEADALETRLNDRARVRPNYTDEGEELLEPVRLDEERAPLHGRRDPHPAEQLRRLAVHTNLLRAPEQRGPDVLDAAPNDRQGLWRQLVDLLQEQPAAVHARSPNDLCQKLHVQLICALLREDEPPSELAEVARERRGSVRTLSVRVRQHRERLPLELAEN